MADSNKSEKATPQRRQKARRKGQVARSRELSSVLSWGAALLVLTFLLPNLVVQWRGLFARMLDFAVEEPLRPGGPAFFWTSMGVFWWILPVMGSAWVCAVAGGVMQGGFVMSPEALAPKPERLNPAERLKQMFSMAGMSGLLKSLIPFAAIVWIGVSIFQSKWPVMVQASSLHLGAFASFLASAIWEMVWKSGLVFLAWAGIDYALIWRKLESDLKMSRQELRQEVKESEGNPEVKGRIRRMQRHIRRKQMLRDTETASVVIANPTHYAIALRYEMSMEAPIVVAKGRDLLALEIKEVARWNNVPVMENPPLAHALYRTVAVGRPIPAKLFEAVAEILAFVFRIQAEAQRRQKNPQDLKR